MFCNSYTSTCRLFVAYTHTHIPTCMKIVDICVCIANMIRACLRMQEYCYNEREIHVQSFFTLLVNEHLFTGTRCIRYLPGTGSFLCLFTSRVRWRAALVFARACVVRDAELVIHAASFGPVTTPRIVVPRYRWLCCTTKYWETRKSRLGTLARVTSPM